MEEFLSRNRVRLAPRAKHSKPELAYSQKGSNSLSPRKSKKIEKTKPFSMFPLQ